MSAQKTALVCLIVLVVLLGQVAVQLLPRSTAAVMVRQHRVEVSISGLGTLTNFVVPEGRFMTSEIKKALTALGESKGQ